ncbi:hypothetical protein L6452_15759 [Arctium lappa]|uniref:Uncharacterized protein n=1 Tax=Arctium lappa TaxID=4217 RepID=A0ACB9CPR9_ARCLA|nr:hypothetical protein L6452_15759 [Arctium lappa]
MGLSPTKPDNDVSEKKNGQKEEVAEICDDAKDDEKVKNKEVNVEKEDVEFQVLEAATYWYSSANGFFDFDYMALPWFFGPDCSNCLWNFYGSTFLNQSCAFLVLEIDVVATVFLQASLILPFFVGVFGVGMEIRLMIVGFGSENICAVIAAELF